tara:strand:+ start:1389 stop:2510 length:1122 start_codon:yes stop_codon:yes gene_type:complete
MARTKIDSAEYTNFSAKDYSTTASFQDPTLYPSSYTATQSESTSESYYQDTKWADKLGTYLEISEIAGMVDKKAMFVVGKGYKTKKKFMRKDPLKNVTGNGLDTANTIFYNAVRTYTIGGDFYAEIVRNARGELKNLKPLNPSTIKVLANSQGMITGYLQVSENKDDKAVPFKTKDIFHLAYNRIADQIHGQSLITKLNPMIEMRRESMKDMRVVFHRYVKPLLISAVDTDDETEIKNYKDKLDSAMEKGENMVVPKGILDGIEKMSIPQFSTLDPLPWIKMLQNEFLKAEGVPSVVLGIGGESSEAESKILYLAWQQVVEWNQMFLEEQISQQLGINVEFEFPASISPELISDEKKDPSLKSNKVNPSKDQK